ncbi:MAG TPA: hypothetical protein VIY08_07540 [Candidatus Nitrosocosmicus sp.]
MRQINDNKKLVITGITIVAALAFATMPLLNIQNAQAGFGHHGWNHR